MLWHWLKQLDARPDEILSEDGTRAPFSGPEFREGLSLAEAFLHYPLDLKPAPPDGILPKTWEAKTRGFYSFRNTWTEGPDSGPDAIVAQVYAKAGPPCGWNQAEAGCFQIYGLGHPWAWKDNDASGKTGSRWLDNVVMLPDDPIDAWSHGRVTDYQADPRTGTGSVAFNLDDVYQCVRKIGQGKAAREEPYDAGIRGNRAFAVDFSGKAGVPALLAVADHITGGGRKVWMWQLPPAGRDGPSYQTAVGPNGFTLAYKDASLKATFVTPVGAGVKIAKAQGRMKGIELSGIPDTAVNAIHVTNADPTGGDFFAVMTLQRANAPEVKVEGGKARVGGRTVSFDGQKLRIE